jgi:hypothetical protein
VLRGIDDSAELAHSVVREAGARGLAGREARRAALALLLGWGAIRAVHVSQAYLDLATGWDAYRRPALVAVLAVAGTLETGWVIARSWRRGRLDPVAVTVDVAFGAAALALIATAVHGGDGTTSLNWVLPYTVGAAVGAGLALPVRPALLVSLALGAVYVLSVWPELVQGRGAATAAVVNAVSYLGFCAAAIVTRTVLFSLVGQLMQARAEAVSRGEQLAAERERARHRRLIHDSALQTLEAVAKGWGEGSDSLRRRAHEESLRLRLALRDEALGDEALGDDVLTGGEASLRARLGLLAAEFAGLGRQ